VSDPEVTVQTRVGPEPAVRLSNGVAMPLLGIGTWQLQSGDEAERAVAWALEDGYRHVDTAQGYRNETSVGAAIRSSGLARDDVFVTTKMTPTNDDPLREIEGSLARLGLDYVDLYLIHYPGRKAEGHWPGFEHLYAQGLARAIGVSNFPGALIDRMIATATIPPMVNQVEWHPEVYDPNLLAHHQRMGVVLEGYSPLGIGRLLRNPVVEEIAARRSRTPAQVLIRWNIQRGVPAIPKSASRERIVENHRVFDFTLSEAEIGHLDGLGRDA
jgi:diketogulonate reductase-like aldo/keto reductase